MAIAKLIGDFKGFLFSLSILLIPSDPEVFGLPSYLFWFTGIYLIALSISDFDSLTNQKFCRSLAIATLFGLSGPIILTTVPVYFVRVLVDKVNGKAIHRTLLLGGMTLIVSAIQALYYLGTRHNSDAINTTFGKILSWPLESTGSYLVGIQYPSWNLQVGILLFAVFIFSIFALPKSLFPILIFLLLVMSALQTALRVDTDVIHPIISAPRYYFVTYILTGWLIIDLIYRTISHRVASLSIGLVIVLMSGYSAHNSFDRNVLDFHWSNYFASCKNFENINAPVQVNGSYQGSWTLELDRSLCNGGYWDRYFPSNNHERTLAFRFIPIGPNANDAQIRPSSPKNGVCRGSISHQDGFDGSDYFKSEIEGYDILGSFTNLEDRGSHSIDIRVEKGQVIHFRWGTGANQSITLWDGSKKLPFESYLPPSQEWLTLTFDNSDLPDSFLVRISDRSYSWGSWSAVAVRRDC